MQESTQAPRPFILVLAGVNGAGKSSVGGSMIAEHGLDWFNPDTYARQLVGRFGLELAKANAQAWNFGRDLLEKSIDQRSNYAFETTLGARTIPDMLSRASKTHDVLMLFCGLSTAEQHIQRVKLRVRHGGHDISEEKIRERWIHSRLNLIRLLPYLARLQVFDNSVDVAPGQEIQDPMLLLEMDHGQMVFPRKDDRQALLSTPLWARPIGQAATEVAASH